MATSVLNLHSGGNDVTRQELAMIEVPSPTRTWYPIKHSEVLDSVEGTLEGAGFTIEQERLSVSHQGHRFFGTLDLSTQISDGINLCVGIRNSSDQSFPIGFCAGQRVFVCSNLSFHSEIVVSKKHTRFSQERYREGIASAVSSLNQFKEAQADWVDRLRSWKLEEDRANSILLTAYETNVIGARLLPHVIQEWRHPQYEEFEPRTGWSLLNAFTTCLADQNPSTAALTTIKLQKLLAPSVAV